MLLMVENADCAIREASLATGALVIDYTAAPVYMSDKGSGSHEWLIEFEKKPDDLERFVQILDNTLKSINSDYEAKRNFDFILKKPIVHSVSKGTFYNWLKTKDKLGGQHKVPRLCNDRKYVDEVLGMNSEILG